jgi:hypothetical protein
MRNGVLPETSNQEAVKTVDQEGPTRPYEGQGVSEPHQSDGAFIFDRKRQVYMHIVLSGFTIYASYTIVALGKFLKHGKKKRSEMVQQEWFIQRDNPPIHTAAVIRNWLPPEQFRCRSILPNSLISPPRDFFLFMMVKEGAGWPPPVPGEPQEHLGRGGSLHHHQKEVCHFRRWFE